MIVQCGESSPAKHGEAYFSAVVWPRILAITGGGFEKPHALHNSLEIHLARTFGATGKEQPSPPLHPAAAAGLLRCFDKYKSLYTRNMIASRFLVYNDLYLSKHLSSPAAAAG